MTEMNLLLLDGERGEGSGGGPPSTPNGRGDGGVLAYGFSLDLLGVVDFDGYVRLVNSAREGLLGYAREELLGQRAVELIHPNDRERVLAELERARDRGYPSVLEARVRARDGSYLSVLWSAGASDEEHPLYEPGPTSKTAPQPSDGVETTTALEQSNRQLELFACDVAHDLSEPLRMVSVLAGRLGETYGSELPEDARRLIRSIRDGAERAVTLVADTLAYSKATDAEPQRSAVDCTAVLGGALELLEETISELDATVTHDRLPTVEGDAVQLEQVFRNLVSNALKFHNGGPIRVHVTACRVAAGWLFSVEDNGIGVEASACERIFEMFRRGHADIYAGSGIGLSICKRIVERHGGAIWAEPRPTGGSVFHFTIPDGASR